VCPDSQATLIGYPIGEQPPPVLELRTWVP
jgi:hypothetical protein